MSSVTYAAPTQYLNLDFETASAVALKKTGVHPYIWHPDSEFHVTTCSYRLPGKDIQRWPGFYDDRINLLGAPFPDDLAEAIAGGMTILAWNAAFERAVLAWCGQFDARVANIPPEQFYCTMQRAAILGLPLGLKNCGDALGLSQVKSLGDGREAMMTLAKPRNCKALPKNEVVLEPKKGGGHAWYSRHIEGDDNAGRYELMDEYCDQDVVAEEAISDELPWLSVGEKKITVVDTLANSRGLPVDEDAVHRALELTDFLKEDNDRLMQGITGGAVAKASSMPDLKTWLEEQGHPMSSLTKDTIPVKLAEEGVPENVRQALELRLEGGAASLTKIQAMKNSMLGGSIRDTFAYSKAHTGRWAGRGLQPQNMWKGLDDEKAQKYYGKSVAEVQEEFFAALKQDKPIAEVAEELRDRYGNLIDITKDMLRGFICAPEGYSLYVCDFAGIENRVLAWLAGEESMLDAFRRGDDLYVITAAGIYDVPEAEVTKAQRALGKVAVLAAQFGQGWRGFKATCARWGIEITDAEAKAVVAGYRKTYQKVTSFWYDLNNACIRTANDGQDRLVGLVKVTRTEIAGKPVLQVWAPHGKRAVHYWNPMVREEVAPWSWTEATMHAPMTKEQVEQCNMQPVLSGKPVELQEWMLTATGKVTWKLRDCDVDSLAAAFGELEEVEYGEYHELYCYQLYHEKTDKRGQWCHLTPGEKPNRFRNGTWHGVLVENITQMIAREVLAEATLRLDAQGYQVIGYVHDEILALVEDKDKGKSYEDFERIMLQAPGWTKGLPIAGEGYQAKRYHK